MVCKEDVVSWFKNLKSHTRIDVMCNLFNLCLPWELRFLGTCLEDLGKRDFHDLRKTETGANNPSELSSKDLNCISDKRARTKLALYISLLHSCNYACSNGYYKILANVEEVNSLIKCNGVTSADDEVLEELLLIYTLALNHPAFTFEQKLFLTDMFSKLQEEDDRRQSVKRTSPRVGQGPLGIESLDKIAMQAYQPSPSPDQVPLHPPVTPGHCNPITSAALTGDPLVSMPDPLMGFFPYPMMAGYHSAMMLPPPPAEQRSPIISRTNSPCQSNSPSRAGSPGRPKTLPTSFNRPPPTMESPHLPNMTSVKPSMDQLKRLTDEELREQGFDSQSLAQFRALEKNQVTNGFNLGGKKPSHEPEPLSDASGGALKRYNSAEGPLNPTPLYLQWPGSCRMCYLSNGYPGGNRMTLPHPNHLACHVKSLSLDRDSSVHNSSTSDSASDHSPPDTPGLSTASDRGNMTGPIEAWEEQDERRLVGGRGRGIGRSHRSNPPGIQTLPRGRGHNPPHRRRDGNSANGTMDERKIFSASDGVAAFPYSAPLFPQTPTSYMPTYPSFTQGSVFRIPFHPPNGEIMYQPLHPGQFLPTRPAPPTHLPFSPPFPPPKICCYNCGSQNHIGTDCPEATIEEITNKGQYRIDYSNNANVTLPKAGGDTSQDK